MQLATEKQFLRGKFRFEIGNASDSNVDFERVPSIREAIKAIRTIGKSSKHQGSAQIQLKLNPNLRSSKAQMAILAMQQELDAKRDEFISRVKAILESERAKGNDRIITDLDGEIYELTKRDIVLDLCHKHGAFYHDYRLVRLGKPMK